MHGVPSNHTSGSFPSRDLSVAGTLSVAGMLRGVCDIRMDRSLGCYDVSPFDHQCGRPERPDVGWSFGVSERFLVTGLEDGEVRHRIDAEDPGVVEL